MKTYNMCKRMDKETIIVLNKYAKRLEADELIIHKDGSITLTCKDGIICDRYRPAAHELYSEHKTVL